MSGIRVTQIFVEIDYTPRVTKNLSAKISLKFSEGAGENILMINDYDLKPNFRVIQKKEDYDNVTLKASDYKTVRFLHKGKLIIEGFVQADTRKELVRKITEIKSNIFDYNTPIQANVNSYVLEVYPLTFKVSIDWKFKKEAVIRVTYHARNIN